MCRENISSFALRRYSRLDVPLYETEMLPRARMSPRINNDLHLAYACSVMFAFTQLNNSVLICSYLPRKDIAKKKKIPTQYAAKNSDL